MRLSVTERQGVGIVALALVAVAAILISEVPGMPGGAPDEPGPSALPVSVAVLLIVTAGLLVLRGFIGRQQAPELRIELAHSRVGVAFAGLVLVAALFDHLGALLTMTLFLVLCFRAFAELRWPAALGAACLGALAAFGFFDTLLGVRLPRGVLNGLL